MLTINGYDFEWMNAPRSWSTENGVVTVKTDPNTDFWRKTHYGFIKNDGHFLRTVQAGNFEFSLQFSGTYRDLYDQAGLMIYQNSENWIKAGIEYVNGFQNANRFSKLRVIFGKNNWGRNYYDFW